ncbi:transglycosylase domain-containing protein [Candidatus Paracaedibacter symbiosus]|uniref:transglycosylase domain-containing protein n=1 Tax=Candidatus Paracaedibacter symbiosus TaxID=244582 RepID=UPI00068AE3B7|nr:transglycosylase domain-containing protein [Candidatus Paracaedibacter symbiosus]
MSIYFKLKWLCLVAFIVFALKTYHDVQPVEELYRAVIQDAQNLRITDRHGQALFVDFHQRWNHHDQQPLHKIPNFLQQSLIFSEDKNFFSHHGVDWQAKVSALWQNIKARHVVRGASTITEQVVHLLTARPRTIWSKWLEVIEATLLERKVSKNHILEFYINQVPFASNRHGMIQAARYYFDRDLSTLTKQEILALILLIKAPSSYDLKKSVTRMEQKLQPFAQKLGTAGILSPSEQEQITTHSLTLEKTKTPINATHFVRYLQKYHQTDLHLQRNQTIRTTLDAPLQDYAQRVLDQRLRFLKPRQVNNGSVLVLDHTSGEVLAWVVGGASLAKDQTPGAMIDAVTALRQPGSALKPFVYALALIKGWNSTTMIDDAPLSGPVGCGMHKFKNYSNIHYGPVTVREALANSLNVPAVKAIQYVGVDCFLDLLKKLGFTKLQRGADIYEEGLALGNGEVSLLELARAYATLADKGATQELKFFLNYGQHHPPVQVFSHAVASIIGDILSDPWARRLEFGNASVMNLPIQTAVKTGTSSDYRDAWIVGYNHKYVVATWMGNLDNTPMDGITGSIGPALTLRSIFAFLNRSEDSSGLPLSPDLIQRDVCIKRTQMGECIWHSELLLPDDIIGDALIKREGEEVKILKPTPGLKMAIDPRVPDEKQKFEFKLTSLSDGDRVEWIVDENFVATTYQATYLWPLIIGKHRVKACIYKGDQIIYQTPEVGFLVK